MTKEIYEISEQGRQHIDTLERAHQQRSALRSTPEKLAHMVEMEKMQPQIEMLTSERTGLMEPLKRA
eukprot:2566142-Amphidinium_carterae.2